MITIVAKSILKQDRKEEFKAVAKELIAESRKEKGNISYTLYEDINDPNTAAFIEVWKDEEAIKLHNESSHFKSLVPKLSELREGKPEVNKYREI